MEMDKEEAVEYLIKRNKVRELPEEEEEVKAEFTKEEKKFWTKAEREEIEEVMKEGKIYGDPVVELKE